MLLLIDLGVITTRSVEKDDSAIGLFQYGIGKRHLKNDVASEFAKKLA